MADKPVGQLLRQFAVPSIIAMLVSSLYNIIDQLFIGQSIGLLGNAATNIAFPLTPTCVAFSLMFGIGGAARFNLAMGAGRKKEAAAYMGNALYRHYFTWISFPDSCHWRRSSDPCRRQSAVLHDLQSGGGYRQYSS